MPKFKAIPNIGFLYMDVIPGWPRNMSYSSIWSKSDTCFTVYYYDIYIYIQYILCNIFAHAVNRFCKVLKLITRVRGRWQVECFYKIIKGPAYPIRGLKHSGDETSEMLSDGDNESMVLEYTGLHEYLMQPSGHFVNRLWTFCVNGLCCQVKTH